MTPDDHVLLIGGERHGMTHQDCAGDRLEVVLSERLTERPVWSFGHDLTTVVRVTATYVRSRHPRVFILEGYDHTPDDEELVRERLGLQ